MKIRCTVLLALVLGLCAGCSAQKLTAAKPGCFAVIEDFKPGPEGGLDLIWSTARISDFQSLRTTLQSYDSLMLGQVWLAVDRQAAQKIDEEQILQIAQEMVRAIKAKLGYSYKLVDTPTRETLRLNIALSNLETPEPILLVTKNLLTKPFATVGIAKLVIGEESGRNSFVAELLVSDAHTDEALIFAIDQHFASSTLGTTTSHPDEAPAAISQWLERLWTTLSYWNWI